MISTLYPHQVHALEMLKHSLRTGHRRPMLQASVGFGKTKLAAAIVDGALKKGKRVIFGVPALSLIDQTVKSFWQEDIRDVSVIQGDHEMANWARPVQVVSLPTLARRNIPPADIVVIDEAHEMSDFVKKWMQMADWRGVPFVGLSATPWTKGLGNHYDDLLIAATTKQLIENGYLTPFKVYAPSHPDLTGVRTVGDDYNEADLAKVFSKKHLSADIVESWLQLGENRSTLCFAVDRAHAKTLEQEFAARGVRTAYIDAYTTREQRSEIGERFQSGDVKMVVNVGTLTTGVDWDVRCIILARSTKSEKLLCLDAETEILTSRGWKGIGEIRVGDCVAACDGADQTRGRWSNVNAVVEREMEPTESWVEYDAPRANFRVTDRHRMIFRGGNDSRGFRIAEAREMVGYGDGVRIPTAVSMEQTGVPLTLDELYFVGMMMADGTWTATKGAITQSERHPEIIARIEASLQGCGIGYAKRRIKLHASSPAFQERYPRWVFTFSAGKPAPHKRLGSAIAGNECKTPYEFISGTTGYQHLIPYLDKDFAPALFQMSKAQLLALLSGLWDGDGTKKLGVDYTPQSLEICSARRVLMDRLQALCAINGLTANLRQDKSPSRKGEMYYITITDKDWRSCGGYSSANRGPRPKIELKPSTKERVWCVESEAGTIVTRRRGKVTVMGNCQIIGRGLRTAEGKEDLIVLDHGDSHLNLGFVTDIHHETLDVSTPGKKRFQKRNEKLPKECVRCHFLKPIGVHACPQCGFAPVQQSQVTVDDGKLIEFDDVAQRADKATKQRWMNMFRGYADSHGKTEKWVLAQYKSKFGVWPRGLDDGVLEPESDVLGWIRHQQIKWAKRNGGANARAA